MRITSIEIKKFRCLENINIKLGKHLTVIAGHNMTGKSTILALLAHSSAIKKNKPLLKTAFASDWSEIIKTDASEKQYKRFAKILFDEDIHDDHTKSIEYSTTIQLGTRYRILPRYRNGVSNKGAHKIQWPVIYLGLSRLYPIGESEKSEKINTSREISAYLEEIKHAYNKILSIPEEDIKSFESYDLNIKAKKATGVETTTYKSYSNSSGQDNLGQIIMSILSFKKLKTEKDKWWNGGLLLIDEIDATMHPYALLKLIDYMYKQSEDIGIQIVFTTHSMTVMEHIVTKVRYNTNTINNYELNYLTSANRIVENCSNIEIDAIYNDLFITTSNQRKPFLVPLYAEDDEARWFLDKILTDCYHKKIKRIDISLGCEDLLKLLANDYEHFSFNLFLFDGDVKEDIIKKYEQKASRKEFKNIIKLPSDTRPEEILYKYIKNLPSEHNIFGNPQLNAEGYTYRKMIETGHPQSYTQYDKERDQYKQWFKDNLPFMEEAIHHWIGDNQQIVNEFNKNFKEAYNYIAKISMKISPIM